MRYFRYFIGMVWISLVGCSDTSRDGYDIPDSKEIAQDKQLSAVLSQLSESIKSNPSNPSNYYKRAYWQYEAGNLDEALIDVSRAERLSPNSGEILFLKATILYKAGKENALENALFAEDQGFDTPGLYTLIGNLYLNKKDFNKAREYFNKAETMYPYDSEVFNGKGRYYAMQRDTLTAVNNYKRALQLKPSTFAYYDDLIKIYGKAGLIDSALFLNERAIKKFPEKKELVYNKAFVLENAGLLDSSVRIYRQFLKAEPERYDVYERIGNIYFRKKNYASAFANYNKWAELDKENPTPALKAARVYVAQDNYPAAKYYLNKALEKHPDSKILKGELAAVNYRLEQLTSGYYAASSQRKNNKANETAEEDRRIFDRSIEINQLPKRRTIGRDTTRN